VDRKVFALFGFCAAAALPMPVGTAHPGFSARPNPLQITSSDAYDDDLLYSNRGAMVLLPGRSNVTNNSDLLRYSTDSCGELKRFEQTRPRIRHSSLPDGDDPDEQDPFAEAQSLIGQWLSVHAEVGVVHDAVAKSCWGNGFDEGDLAPEFIASAPQELHPVGSSGTSYIA
jgi:hypothetical protein